VCKKAGFRVPELLAPCSLRHCSGDLNLLLFWGLIFLKTEEWAEVLQLFKYFTLGGHPDHAASFEDCGLKARLHILG